MIRKFQLNIYDFLFIIVLIAGFLISIYRFESKYPVGEGDVSRDYLVANHIIEYKEFPKIGPWNGIYSSLRNSPLYFYILALFLTINNNILFLALVNIILQSFTAILVYIIAKWIFTSGTALITSFLYIFSFEIRMESSFVWQPHLMLPFFYTSLFLLLLSYRRNSFVLILLSIFIYFFSAALHYSVLSTMPMVVILVIILLTHQKRKIEYYIISLLFGVISFLLYYFPVLIYLLGNNNLTFLITEDVYIKTIMEFLTNFYRNILTLLNIFFFNQNYGIFSINFLLVVILIIGGLLYFYSNKIDKHQKVKLIVILFFILQTLFFSSFLKTFIFHHYFTPIFGLFIILIAEIIDKVLSKKFFYLKILLVILLIKTLSSDFVYIKWDRNNDLNLQNVASASQALREEILELQSTNSNENIRSFRIALFKKGDGVTFFDSVFWVQLEKLFKIKFTKLVDEINNYEPLNKDKNVFLVCEHYDDEINERKECIDTFLKGNVNYIFNKKYLFVKKIYDQKPYTIYLTKSVEE